MSLYVFFLELPTFVRPFAIPIVRRLAKEQNVLVVCTIHQPNFDTFSLFDRLLLLAGGQVMYDGPTGAFLHLSLASPCCRLFETRG